MEFLRTRFVRTLLGFVVFSLSMIAPVGAQSTITVRVQWDPNPAAEGVSQYSLAVDGNTPIAILASNCTASLCEQSVTLPPGSHTFSVVAINQWGASAPTAVTAVIAPPGPPKNVRIVK